MSRKVRKRTFWHVRRTKTQICLRIRSVWSEPSLSAWRNFAVMAIQNAHRKDSDQTAHSRSLIWIFTGRPCLKVRFLTLRFKWVCLMKETSLGHSICLYFIANRHGCRLSTVKPFSRQLRNKSDLNNYEPELRVTENCCIYHIFSCP